MSCYPRSEYGALVMFSDVCCALTVVNQAVTGKERHEFLKMYLVAENTKHDDKKQLYVFISSMNKGRHPKVLILFYRIGLDSSLFRILPRPGTECNMASARAAEIEVAVSKAQKDRACLSRFDADSKPCWETLACV